MGAEDCCWVGPLSNACHTTSMALFGTSAHLRPQPSSHIRRPLSDKQGSQLGDFTSLLDALSVLPIIDDHSPDDRPEGDSSDAIKDQYFEPLVVLRGRERSPRKPRPTSFNPVEAFQLPPIKDYRVVKNDNDAVFTRKVEAETSVPEAYPAARRTTMDGIRWIAKFRPKGMNSDFIRWKRYLPNGERGAFKSMTYREGFGLASKIGRAIDELGYAPMKNFPDAGYHTARKLRLIGTAMVSDHHYPIIELACQMAGITMVPIYSTLSADHFEVIVREVKMDTLFVDLPTLKIYLFESLHLKRFFPQRLVIVGDSDGLRSSEGQSLLRAIRKRKKIEVITIDSLLCYGKLEKWHKWRRDDIWTITYTSGTLGTPKGVLLTMENMRAGTWSIIEYHVRDIFHRKVYKQHEQAGRDNIYFSYLPVAHIFERSMHQVFMQLGYVLAFGTGDEQSIFAECKEAETTEMVCVPRVLEILNRAVGKTLTERGTLSAGLFNQGIAHKIALFRATGMVESNIWDKIIMRQVRDSVVGEHLKSLISGGASLSEMVKLRCQAFLCAKIFQGYGTTETSGATSVQHSCQRDNSIGFPLKTVESKLVDRPELGFYAKKGIGELYIRGNVIGKGYFRRPEETRRGFTKDGWYRTGDICELDRHTGIWFIDRFTNFFNLEGNHNIAPERVELAIGFTPGIESSFVTHCGESKRIICFLEMDEPYLSSRHANRTGRDLLCDPGAQRMIIEGVFHTAKEHGLQPHEVPTRFAFMDRALGPNDGILTPSLKVQRGRVHDVLHHTIDYITYTGDNVCVNMDNAVNAKPIQDCIIQHAQLTSDCVGVGIMRKKKK